MSERLFTSVSIVNEYTEKKIKVKNFNDVYLYGKTNYDKMLFEFIMKAEVVDKSNKSFAEIRHDMKRRSLINNVYKIVDSKKVEFLIGSKPLPRAFRVFYAKDPRTKEEKVFIDCTGIITNNNGVYNISNKNIDFLVAYLMSAMMNIIYYNAPLKLINNNDIITSGAICFSNMYSYIIDFLRVSGVSNYKNRCKYLATKYFMVNILCKENDDRIDSKALQLSGISERESDLMKIQVDKEPYTNIKDFVEASAKVLKAEEKLTLDVFMNKWLYVYGSGTQFALELFPAFANMLIYSYIGIYINNQKTIENVCGNDMVTFVKAIIKVGESID